MRSGELVAGIIIVLALIIGIIIECGSRQAWERMSSEYDASADLIAYFDGMAFYADKMGGFYVREVNGDIECVD
jgi:hypothetical protein